MTNPEMSSKCSPKTCVNHKTSVCVCLCVSECRPHHDFITYFALVKSFMSFFVNWKSNSVYCGGDWQEVCPWKRLPPLHVCDFCTLLHCMLQCPVLCCFRAKKGRREIKKKKRKKGLPHRQIWDLWAPLVPQSQLPGSDWCLLSAVWCPFIHSLTSLPLSPSSARR